MMMISTHFSVPVRRQLSSVRVSRASVEAFPVVRVECRATPPVDNGQTWRTRNRLPHLCCNAHGTVSQSRNQPRCRTGHGAATLPVRPRLGKYAPPVANRHRRLPIKDHNKGNIGHVVFNKINHVKLPSTRSIWRCPKLGLLLFIRSIINQRNTLGGSKLPKEIQILW